MMEAIMPASLTIELTQAHYNTCTTLEESISKKIYECATCGGWGAQLTFVNKNEVEAVCEKLKKLGYNVVIKCMKEYFLININW